MANDFTIGKMYQFIHEYNNGGAYDSWVTAADANGDGTLIKSEFEQWIAEELPYWNGLEASEVRGTLNEFWYGLDINRSAKEIKGTRTYVSVDGGMTDNIRPSLYQAGYECAVVNKMNNERSSNMGKGTTT